MERRLWTKEELILAFNLYLKLPFGKMHRRTPEIIELSEIMGRTVNSVTIRLTNYAACDPFHQNRGVKGMIGGIKQCQPIWDEFFSNQEELIFLSEKILAEKQSTTIENKFSEILNDIDYQNLNSGSVLRQVKTRVNQSFFRQIVVTNYNNKCAISGIDLPELLVASHIIPWSLNEKERLNPENGICFSSLYDKAFDKGLITLSDDYKIIISNHLKKSKEQGFYKDFFQIIENKQILDPLKYLPKLDFIKYHQDEIFSKRN